MKKALITGITGMDGSHLADFLLKKDYIVYGMERRSSSKQRVNINHLLTNQNFHLVMGDLTDQSSLMKCIKQADPDEIYNLASQSFVGESWNTAIQTSDVTGLGVLRMLEAIKEYENPIKFYQASSSEMFGKIQSLRQNEDTPFYPRSPYGVSKQYGHWITKNYRESYDMFNCSGILFNHESERRGIEFVTRKISNGIAQIYHGMSDHITLGNLDSKRDWGYAPDYVEAMWLMMQQDEPDDFVISTGETHSIKEFLDIGFKLIGETDWLYHVKQDPRFMRPAEVDILTGDSTKARKTLGWKPKTTFEELVNIMVQNDIELIEGKLRRT
jgi:GDPmannose 4,6-dehydratase